MNIFKINLHPTLFDPERGSKIDQVKREKGGGGDKPYAPYKGNENFGNVQKVEQEFADKYMKLLEDGTIDKVVTYNDEGILQLELGNIEESKRAEVAEVILRWNGKMEKVCLSGLMEMSDGIIYAMKDKGIRNVYLASCKKIQPGQIEQIGNLGVKNIELYGLDSLDYEQAKALGNFERVRLSDLITQEHLKPEILKELCNVKRLSLEGVTDLSPEQAKCFENCNVEGLVLGLEKITDEQARCLSGISELTILMDVSNLSPEQVKIFSNGKVKKIRFSGYVELLFNVMGESDL